MHMVIIDLIGETGDIWNRGKGCHEYPLESPLDGGDFLR